MRARDHLSQAEAALASFEGAVAAASRSLPACESGLLRLMFTYNAILNASRKAMLEHEHVKVGGAKSAVGALRRHGWLTEEDARAVIEVGRDHRLAFDAYRTELREHITNRLPRHAAAMRRWIEALQDRAAAADQVR